MYVYTKPLVLTISTIYHAYEVTFIAPCDPRTENPSDRVPGSTEQRDVVVSLFVPRISYLPPHIPTRFVLNPYTTLPRAKVHRGDSLPVDRSETNPPFPSPRGITRSGPAAGMSDRESHDLREIRDRLRVFARERDWDQFHTPRNLGNVTRTLPPGRGPLLSPPTSRNLPPSLTRTLVS